MDNHTATEQAYKNVYEQGKKDAVRHGGWKLKYETFGEMQCSICGSEALVKERYYVSSNFCPNCGAIMDGGDAE